MIGEFSFDNYRFFADDSNISFVADKRTKKLLSNSVSIDNRQILKSIAIYGGNNCGKTNIVSLLKKIKAILLGEENVKFNSKIFNDSELFSFSIIYNNNDGMGWIKYEFEFNHSTNEYVKEKISTITYYDTGKPTINDILDLDRKSKVLKIYDQDKSRFLNVVVGQKPFVFSVRVDEGEFASLKIFKDSFSKLSDSLVIIDLNNFPFDNTLNTYKSNHEKKKKFITSFVKHADLSIESLDYKNTEAILDNTDSYVNEKALKDVTKIFDAFKLYTTYGKTKVPSLLFDSSGTKKIEAVASFIYDTLSEGKTLIIDEMDNGLHFKLSRAIVSLFNNIANIKGQLLFTAHDLLLVDCGNLMRKEQICFVERTQKEAKIYCLGDATVAASGLREGNELIKRYCRGNFGYVPSPNFISELLSLRM